MAYRSVGTGSNGTGTAAAPGVPSGLQVDDIVVVGLYLDGATETVTAPTGFTQKTAETTNSTTRGRLYTFWKRITVAGDATDEGDGDYDFTWATSQVFEAVAIAFSGRVRTGDPFDATSSTSNAGTTATTVAATVTTVVDADDIVAFSSNHATNAGDFTAPSGMTERFDATAGGAGHHLGAYTQDNAGVAGGYAKTATSTGTTGNSVPKIIVGGLQADRVVVRDSVGTTGNTGSALTLSLPTHVTDDRLLAFVTGKYGGTADQPTIDQGWTLVKYLTGGTGSVGVGTGLTFLAIFAKDATSSSETAPVVTPGATAPNNWHAQVVSLVHGSGMAWRDAIATSAAWIEGTQDTDASSSTFTGTTSAFAGQPTTGDIILGLHGGPSSAASAFNAQPSITATGVSNGLGTTVVRYAETASGDDSMSGLMVLQGFTGPATSGVTTSATYTGWALACGVIAHIAVRQELIQPTATLTATDAITAAGAVNTSTGASLSASATITAAGSALAAGEGTASVAETAAITAAGMAGKVSAASLAATDTITAAGSVSAVGATSAAIAATDTITAAGLVTTHDTGTDLTNDDDGLDLDGTAEVVWEPDVAPVPAGLSLGEHRTVARVVISAPTYEDVSTGTLPAPATAVVADIPGLLDRVIIRDVDFTFYRGHPIVIDNYRLIDPLLYGAGQVTIPGINPQFETEFDLDDFQFAPVVIQRRTEAGTVESTDYKGFVSKVNTDGTQLVLELGGQASGRLSAMEVKKPGYRRKQDVEHILVDLLRDARVRAHEHDGVSGVGLIKRGEADGLSIFNETLAVWAGVSGDPITFTPNADGAYRKTVKDTATIHATAYIDSDLISQSLSRDFMSEVTRVYATGRTAAGELVSNFKTPGLTQGDAPDYPMSPGPMVLGDVDADTDSGAGVTAVQEQLAIHNYYDVEDGDPGVYGDEVRTAVLFFQAFAGLGITGEVNTATWNALWNLAEIGYSLDDAREYPMAQDIRTQKWFRTANGSKIEENPDYDPHLIPVDLTIDVGGPFGKGHIRRFAESKLAPAGGVWTGTLTFKSGLIAGEHNPGDPFTTADVMDRRDLQPNMNVWLPYFMGGIVVTISGLDNGPEETQAIVSTLPESTMDTWAAIERMREARSTPGSTWSGHVRKSQVRNDVDKSWDTSSGWIANKVALAGGEWTEVMVPAGQTGIVQRIRMELQTPAEFAVLLTQRTMALGRLNTETATATPLTDPRPFARPWWEREAIADWLEERKWLDAWGTEDQPCGYDPTLKTDDQGPTAQPVTGLFHEAAGLNYETDSEPVLYLYVWTAADNHLLPGRILRNQRTTDF